MPDLEETVWKRATASAGAVYRSASFSISTTIVLLLSGAIGTVLTLGGESTEVIAVGVIAGLAGLLGCLVAVFTFEVLVASVRQRNELRRVLRAFPQAEEPQVPVALADFCRRADDHLRACKAGGYGTDDEQRLEDWTSEVIRFLSRHCDQESGRAFAQASRGSGNFFDRLERRLEALDEISASTPAR